MPWHYLCSCVDKLTSENYILVLVEYFSVCVFVNVWVLLRVLSYLSIVVYCFFALTVQCCELTICSPPLSLSLSLTKWPSHSSSKDPFLDSFKSNQDISLFFRKQQAFNVFSPALSSSTANHCLSTVKTGCKLCHYSVCIGARRCLCVHACMCSKEPLRVGFCAKIYVYHYYYYDVTVSASVYILTYFLFTWFYSVFILGELNCISINLLFIYLFIIFKGRQSKFAY